MASLAENKFEFYLTALGFNGTYTYINVENYLN